MNPTYQKITFTNLAMVLGSLILAFVIPLYVIEHNLPEFRFLDGSVFIQYASFVAVSAYGLLFLIYVPLSLIKRKRLGCLVVYFLIFWITLSGLLLPLVKSSGMVELSEAKIHYSNLFLVLILSLLFAYLSAYRSSKLPTIFSVVLVFGVILSSVNGINRIVFGDKSAQDAGELQLSPHDNILVVSLDGIPSNVAARVLADNPDIRAQLKDFTFFENAVANAPATRASMRNELFGSRNFIDLGRDESNIQKKLEVGDILINKYAENGYPSYVYGTYEVYGSDQVKKLTAQHLVEPLHSQKMADLITLFETVVIRVGSSKLIELLNDYRAEVREYISRAEAQELPSKVLNHQGPDWDASSVLDISVYESILKRLDVGRSEKALFHLHFVHTHFPVDFDANCVYRSDDPEWFKSHQNEAGLYIQTLCAFSQLADLMQRLKKLDVYDNSMIVLKSDHGEPAYYFSNPPHNLMINNHRYWGYNRYQPLLMIKERHSRLDHMQVDDSLVALSDLAKTTCVHSGLGLDCNGFVGVDIIGDDDIGTAPALNFEVVKGEHSDYRVNTHIAVSLERKATLWEMFNESDAIIMAPVEQ